MPIIFNEDSKPTSMLGTKVEVRRLIDNSVATKDQVRLERWRMAPGSSAPLTVRRGDIAWIQILEGSAELDGNAGAHALSNVHLAFLPGGFDGSVASANGAASLSHYK